MALGRLATALLVGMGLVVLTMLAPMARVTAQVREDPRGNIDDPRIPIGGERRADVIERLIARTPDPVKFPVPRTKWDGKPDLNGVYYPGAMLGRPSVPLESLYRSEVRPLRERSDEIDWRNGFENPTFHCWPRSVLTGSMPTNLAIQVVHAPGLLVLIDEEDGRFRIIPIVDGPPKHNKLRKPSYMGDSVAHWEGDTLVVDITNFNGRPWLGGPQAQAKRPPQTSSDALHIVEHWTLSDGKTLDYQPVLVEDSKMLTGTWSGAKVRRERQSYDMILETLCQEDPTLEKLEQNYQNFKKGGGQ